MKPGTHKPVLLDPDHFPGGRDAKFLIPPPPYPPPSLLAQVRFFFISINHFVSEITQVFGKLSSSAFRITIVRCFLMSPSNASQFLIVAFILPAQDMKTRHVDTSDYICV